MIKRALGSVSVYSCDKRALGSVSVYSCDKRALGSVSVYSCDKRALGSVSVYSCDKRALGSVSVYSCDLRLVIKSDLGPVMFGLRVYLFCCDSRRVRTCLVLVYFHICFAVTVAGKETCGLLLFA